MAESTLVGRQPILDAEMRQYAFELLFRHQRQNHAEILDSHQATSKVLHDALNNIGLSSLIGDSTAFINVDYNFLMDPVIELIPPSRFVLEILEDVQVDEALIERIQYLKELGFVFAIDDLDLGDTMMQNFEPLLQLVSILKIDIRTLKTPEQTKEKIKQLSACNLKFLAEKVETLEEFRWCQEMGFHYFQGYFFAKPTIIEGKKLNPNKLTVLRLVALLRADEDLVKIEQEFSSNPALSINLLRYLNSAAFCFKTDISSIRQAINMLGRSPLIQWLTLFIYAESTEDFRNNPLLITALVRAETMTEIAKYCNMNKQMTDKAYLTGLLSCMECMMQVRFPDIFNQIRFETDIVEALIQHRGKLGTLLALALAVEQGEEKVDKILAKLQITTDTLSGIISRCYENINEKYSEAA